MQVNRMFEIVYLLLNKNQVTAKELAKHFEVSTRTIYRDVEVLSQSGIPIYALKGKDGGIKLTDNFIIDKSFLSKKEQNEILTALKGLNSVNYPEINSVISKLSNIFDVNCTNWIEVDFSEWSNYKQETVKIIKDAIINKKRVYFDYYGLDGTKTARKVEPLKLWFKARAWYIKSFCCEKNAMRIFKLTRIKNIVLLDEHFDRQYLEENDKTYENYLNSNIEVVLKISPSQAFRIFDEFDDEQLKKDENGNYIATMHSLENEWLYSYILSYSSYAEVLSPDFIREKIKKRLHDAIKIYKS